MRRATSCSRGGRAAARRPCAHPTCVARVGGDEFLVLLTDLSRDGGIARRSRRRSTQRCGAVRVSGAEFYIGSSVGIALYPRGDGAAAASRRRVLERADTAMYEAKQNGFRRELYQRPASRSTVS